MSDPLHDVTLTATHPEHGSHQQTYAATVGATVFGGILVGVFGLITAVDATSFPLFGAAMLGTVFTGSIAWGERRRVSATLPCTWTLGPHRLLTHEGAVPLEAIHAVEVLDRPPGIVLVTEQRTWTLPQGYRVDGPELRRFERALETRRYAIDSAEERPDARRALETLTQDR